MGVFSGAVPGASECTAKGDSQGPIRVSCVWRGACLCVLPLQRRVLAQLLLVEHADVRVGPVRVGQVGVLEGRARQHRVAEDGAL